jgi:hypothetical protein
MSCVCVLGDEPERLPLTSAANEDRRVGLLDGLWAVHLLREVDPFAVEGAGLAAPGAMGDLERVFEQLEPVGPTPVLDAERCVLAFVPRRPDTEIGPARPTGRRAWTLA